METLETIKARLTADKAEFTASQYDQSIRDREYLLALLAVRDSA